jgi:acetyl esterase/lipase
MLRRILIILFFIISLLAVFPTPEKHIWYITILVTEFPWIFLTVAGLLMVWSLSRKKYRGVELLVCGVSFVLFFYPVGVAYSVGYDLRERIEHSFGKGSGTVQGLQQHTPYAFYRMMTGIGADQVTYTTSTYATHTGIPLTLDFYRAQLSGSRPCILVVHGGSWKSDNSQELPDINWYLARQGYNVASVNYRLAPTFKSPSPIEDVAAAFTWLKSHAAELNIDTTNFVLLGRSAGGQIVLQSAYTLPEPGIRGVVSFYGPTDMVWAYNHPDNPLVMDSKKVLSDFLGGSDTEVPKQYAEASPINYVTNKTVPTLMIHGGNDAHVHYELSELLDKKLEDNHVPHLLLGLPWATHGCEYTLNGPSGQLAKYTIERFVHAVTAAKR